MEELSDRLYALADLVRRMRWMQTQYFKTRKRGDLLLAKELEQQVDAAVIDIISKEN